jgi:hypothetical protein
MKVVNGFFIITEIAKIMVGALVERKVGTC